MKDDQVNFRSDSTAIPVAAPTRHMPCHLKTRFDGVTQTMAKG